MENITVAKFGGSSMADAESIGLVAGIVFADPARRVIVVSAPGVSRYRTEPEYSQKVTQQLYRQDFESVRGRFLRLGHDLGVQKTTTAAIDEVQHGLNQRMDRNEFWLPSRGEYIAARMFAGYIGAQFIDAAELISFNVKNEVCLSSYERIQDRISETHGLVVIPGFYGVDHQGRVRTLKEGGSDYTGSIIARGVNARLYENWTDVPGVMTADPKVDPNAQLLSHLTYEEMAALCDRGARVLQRDSIAPVEEVGIPINIKSTFHPDQPGTYIHKMKPTYANEQIAV